MSTPKKPNSTCAICGKLFAARAAQIRAGRGRFCSQRCNGVSRIGTKASFAHIAKARDARLAGLRAGKWSMPIGCAHHNWKGGSYLDAGYRVLSSVVTRNGSRYRREHRAVMAAHLGRDLDGDEAVHHINGDKADNRIENLQVLTRAQHLHAHRSDLLAGKKRSRAR